MKHRLRLAVIAILAFLTTACPVTSPALADPKPAPPPKPEHLLPPQPGEVVVKVPGAFDPNSKYRRSNPKSPDYLRNPYVWA